MVKPLSRLLALFSLSILLFSSCEMIDPDPVMVPGYVCIPSFTLVTDETSQGSNYNKIVDMWLYDGGTLLGNIGLPTLIPVQKAGPTSISVQAGVTKSGQDDWRIAYPLIQSYQTTVNLKPNQIDTIYPVFKYLTNAKFEFIEDFDRNGFQFTYNKDYTVTGDTIARVHDPRLPDSVNKNVGKMVVAPSSTSFQIYTTDEYVLPGYNAPVYLEIDYNTDYLFRVGYYYQEPNQPSSGNIEVLQVTPNTGWNKLYINFTDEVSAKQPGTKFKIYIGILKANGQTVNTYIDNVKLVDLP